METKKTIQIKTLINAPISKIWSYWSEPDHITNWCNASPDWHTPRAENDLRKGGKFITRMEAKDGIFGFDFSGIYVSVKPHKSIFYTLDDRRKVEIEFKEIGKQVEIIQIFEPENENPLEMQKGGWQAILDNFKNYVETH